MSWIKDVCLTARDFGAQEALTMGFVSGVYESKAAALDRALVLAKDIAAASPVAVQSTKAVINYSRDHTVADGESLMRCCVLQDGANLFVQVWTMSLCGMPPCYRHRM